MRSVTLALLLSLPTWAAIGATEPVAGSCGTTNAATYALGAFTPTANATLVVMAFVTATVSAGSVTGGSLTWTRETSVAYNAGDTAYVFWANTGASPASTTITVDVTGDNGAGACVFVVQFTGSDVTTANPIKQFKTAATTAANPTITFDAAMGTNNGYMAGFGNPNNPPTSTQPTSWTEANDSGYNSPTSGATDAFRAGGETGSTVTFTAASGAYGMIAVEVYVSGAGPAGHRRNRGRTL